MGIYICLYYYELEFDTPESFKKTQDIITHSDLGKEWELLLNEDGQVELKYHGERYRHDFELFCSIAPYVKDGSYIEIEGGNDRWRYIFQNHECHEITSVLVWLYPPDPPICYAKISECSFNLNNPLAALKYVAIPVNMFEFLDRFKGKNVKVSIDVMDKRENLHKI
jgi:hypothetical protein